MPACTHLDHVLVTELPDRLRRLRGVPGRGRQVGPPAHLPGVRPRRLLRRLPRPPRHGAPRRRPATRSSARSSRARTGRGASRTSWRCASRRSTGRRRSRRRRCWAAEGGRPGAARPRSGDAPSGGANGVAPPSVRCRRSHGRGRRYRSGARHGWRVPPVVSSRRRSRSASRPRAVRSGVDLGARLVEHRDRTRGAGAGGGEDRLVRGPCP